MSFLKTKIQEAAIKLFTSGASKFLLYGGSRSGKSFIIVFAMIIIACKFPGSRHLIARFRFNHVKNSIWLDTLKKCLRLCFPALKVVWNNQDYFITLPNGSEIWIGGIDDKDRAEKILGMEFLTIFLNEASQISYDSYTTLLTRLAQKIEGAKNMLFIDENPPSKKHWTYKIFIEHKEPQDNTDISYVDQYGVLHMNPQDNLDNISPEYIALLESMPKRKRERFLAGLFSDDSEFALWDDATISNGRISPKDLPDMRRIVVAIDPAVSATDTSDETGLVVAGVGFNDHFYVLEDATGKYTPTQWAKKAILLHNKWKADRIVGEVNNGGDLIETVIRNIDKTVPYKAVHATRNKMTRAEPIAAVYEQGKGHHVGEFPDLELEMTTWESKKGEKSPNRIDALTWAGTELEVANIREEAEFGW